MRGLFRWAQPFRSILCKKCLTHDLQLTDAAIFALPVREVTKLQLLRHEKVGLLMVFLLGALSVFPNISTKSKSTLTKTPACASAVLFASTLSPIQPRTRWTQHVRSSLKCSHPGSSTLGSCRLMGTSGIFIPRSTWTLSKPTPASFAPVSQCSKGHPLHSSLAFFVAPPKARLHVHLAIRTTSTRIQQRILGYRLMVPSCPQLPQDSRNWVRMPGTVRRSKS